MREQLRALAVGVEQNLRAGIKGETGSLGSGMGYPGPGLLMANLEPEPQVLGYNLHNRFLKLFILTLWPFYLKGVCLKNLCCLLFFRAGNWFLFPSWRNKSFVMCLLSGFILFLMHFYYLSKSAFFLPSFPKLFVLLPTPPPFLGSSVYFVKSIHFLEAWGRISLDKWIEYLPFLHRVVLFELL